VKSSEGSTPRRRPADPGASRGRNRLPMQAATEELVTCARRHFDPELLPLIVVALLEREKSASETAREPKAEAS